MTTKRGATIEQIVEVGCACGDAVRGGATWRSRADRDGDRAVIVEHGGVSVQTRPERCSPLTSWPGATPKCPELVGRWPRSTRRSTQGDEASLSIATQADRDEHVKVAVSLLRAADPGTVRERSRRAGHPGGRARRSPAADVLAAQGDGRHRTSAAPGRSGTELARRRCRLPRPMSMAPYIGRRVGPRRPCRFDRPGQTGTAVSRTSL